MRRTKVALFGLLLTLGLFAQYLPTDARALNGTRVPFLSSTDFSLWSAESSHRLKSVLPTHCAAIADVQAPEQRCTLHQLSGRWVEALTLRAIVRLRRFERLM